MACAPPPRVVGPPKGKRQETGWEELRAQLEDAARPAPRTVTGSHVIARALAVLDRGWCQHWWAEKPAGAGRGRARCFPCDRQAVAWCLVGSLIRAYWELGGPRLSPGDWLVVGDEEGCLRAHPALGAALQAVTERSQSEGRRHPCDLNNRWQTTREAVQACLKQALAGLETPAAAPVAAAASMDSPTACPAMSAS